jgi:hypothetical protein
MNHRMPLLLVRCHAIGFALLAAILLGACATSNPESTRTRNLLAASGFHTKKPETPEQRAIFSQMPDYAMQGGLIHGRQLYTYKDPSEGAVYVGGDTEYQQYVRLLAQWKKAGEEIQPGRLPGRSFEPSEIFGDHRYWMDSYSHQ